MEISYWVLTFNQDPNKNTIAGIINDDIIRTHITGASRKNGDKIVHTELGDFILEGEGRVFGRYLNQVAHKIVTVLGV